MYICTYITHDNNLRIHTHVSYGNQKPIKPTQKLKRKEPKHNTIESHQNKKIREQKNKGTKENYKNNQKTIK